VTAGHAESPQVRHLHAQVGVDGGRGDLDDARVQPVHGLAEQQRDEREPSGGGWEAGPPGNQPGTWSSRISSACRRLDGETQTVRNQPGLDGNDGGVTGA
jgi:hypothetical protein